MTKLIKDYWYYSDNGLPISQYYEQFTTARNLEVGKVYLQDAGIFWIKYKIVFVGDGVAVGVEVANGNGNSHICKKEMFISGGLKAGWKYNDNRACYRLLKETTL